MGHVTQTAIPENIFITGGIGHGKTVFKISCLPVSAVILACLKEYANALEHFPPAIEPAIDDSPEASDMPAVATHK